MRQFAGYSHCFCHEVRALPRFLHLEAASIVLVVIIGVSTS